MYPRITRRVTFTPAPGTADEPHSTRPDMRRALD